MKSIGFTFNNFNFIVYPFQLSGVDGVITVVDDSITVRYSPLSRQKLGFFKVYF